MVKRPLANLACNIFLQVCDTAAAVVCECKRLRCASIVVVVVVLLLLTMIALQLQILSAANKVRGSIRLQLSNCATERVVVCALEDFSLLLHILFLFSIVQDFSVGTTFFR